MKKESKYTLYNLRKYFTDNNQSVSLTLTDNSYLTIKYEKSSYVNKPIVTLHHINSDQIITDISDVKFYLYSIKHRFTNTTLAELYYVLYEDSVITTKLKEILQPFKRLSYFKLMGLLIYNN